MSEMRSRIEIEEDIKSSYGDDEIQTIALEVLLDIRELLMV